MSVARLLVRRAAVAVVAVWSIVTLVFATFTLTRDWALGATLAQLSRAGADQEDIEAAREQYLAERGLGGPLHEQYLGWLVDAFTLQWGESFHTGADVLPTVLSATVRTAAYVLPALALAAAIGLGIGVYAAIRDGSPTERGARGLAYLGLGLPNVWLGFLAITLLTAAAVEFRPVYTMRTVPPTMSAYPLPFVAEWVFPVLLVATTLLGGITSYARSYAVVYAAADLTTLVRAKGASRLTVVRHVLRNAAVPLVSLLFAESLATLAIAVFVIEALFGIEGLGLLFYNAVWTNDLPVIMGATIVVVVVGVVGNTLQDVAYSALDPRVETGAR